MMTVITQLFQGASVDFWTSVCRGTSAQSPVSLVGSLAGAIVGQPLRLVAVHPDRKLAHRLAELGLTPGVTVTVVQDAGGPLLVAVRGARIAIGRELAQQIEVTPLT
jgi:ferrous iron transport protein A